MAEDVHLVEEQVLGLQRVANHAASFVDGEHLVVAYFESPREIRRALHELKRQDGQRELFTSASEDVAA